MRNYGGVGDMHTENANDEGCIDLRMSHLER